MSSSMPSESPVSHTVNITHSWVLLASIILHVVLMIMLSLIVMAVPPTYRLGS